MLDLLVAAGFCKQFAKWREKAAIGFAIHLHILRHACGCALANRGMDSRLQAYLRHASIMHTVRYTEMSPTRFKGIWR